MSPAAVPANTTSRRAGVMAVHSVDRVVFSVPEIAAAEKFYTAFGLEVKRSGQQVDLYTHGHPHCWMSVFANGQAKALQYIRFGIYAEDIDAFRQKIEALGIACEPHPLSSGDGLWLRSPDGVAMQFIVADKVSPSAKTPSAPARPEARREAMAPARSRSAKVFPRWLSHVLLFTPDVSRMLAFCEEVLGLRLSDRSGDLVAFMHTPHGSDHHLLAFVKSDGAGLHHTSWDVGSLDEVGEGSEQLRIAGFTEGWGVGRHVLGSNYFYYARDPWGSFAEYSFDIDFVSPAKDWVSGDYAPEDSFYLWGPAVPEWFVVNTEHTAPA
ncbi:MULTISPECIES: VOC family protein [Polaromonas]|uniref:VOC family protein n=1 Tax=Polaromonas aquatica TaxID=332657 RepID=A0ABW1TQL5_9BURK